MKYKIGMVVVGCALAGCSNQSVIQTKYSAQQDVCRAETAELTSQSSVTQEYAGVHFSECMNKAGWRVSMPKPAQTAGNGQPAPASGAPSANPSASVGAVPQPPATPPVHAPVPAVPSVPNYRPSGTPSAVPSAAAARYQPARPATVQAPDYGVGAGRRF